MNLTGDFYIVVKKKSWSSLSGRLTSGKPRSVTSDEVPIKLSINVPSTLFSKPQFQAKVTIPDSAVTQPVVDAVVLDNVKEILQQQLGMSIELSLVDVEKA